MRKKLKLHDNSAVPDAMEIYSVIKKYILIRPKSVQPVLKSDNCFIHTYLFAQNDMVGKYSIRS